MSKTLLIRKHNADKHTLKNLRALCASVVVIAFMLSLTFSMTATAQENHEYAPLQEKALKYQDWSFNSLTDGSSVNFRQWAEGKRLVMVVYFASWCANWRYQAPVLARLYDKYKSQGFDVIAVAEYSSVDEVKAFFGAGGAPYTVVVESESRVDRAKTSHYRYRRETGDTRSWGSPYNVIIDPSKMNKEGEVVAERAWVVNGELIESEVDKFLREKLAATAKVITPCK